MSKIRPSSDEATEPQILSSLSSVYAHLLFCRILPPPSTSVESSLQITPFYAKQTQFPKSQMNVSIFLQMDYENISDWTIGESKPNSNPIKANLQKAKMNVNLTLTKDYIKKDDFVVRINKPNFVKGPK